MIGQKPENSISFLKPASGLLKKINPKVTRNSVSDTLKLFREKGLVECINPDEKKGRIYQLTTKGKKIKI